MIDFTTDVGKVRLLINDVTEGDFIFSPEEIGAFLELEDGIVKRAAAQAIDTIADDEALTSKVIKDRDLTTDGAKVADALRKRAVALREQADRDDVDGSGFFGIVSADTTTRVPELTERRWPSVPSWPL